MTSEERRERRRQKILEGGQDRLQQISSTLYKGGQAPSDDEIRNAVKSQNADQNVQSIVNSDEMTPKDQIKSELNQQSSLYAQQESKMASQLAPESFGDQQSGKLNALDQQLPPSLQGSSDFFAPINAKLNEVQGVRQSQTKSVLLILWMTLSGMLYTLHQFMNVVIASQSLADSPKSLHADVKLFGGVVECSRDQLNFAVQQWKQALWYGEGLSDFPLTHSAQYLHREFLLNRLLQLWGSKVEMALSRLGLLSKGFTRFYEQIILVCENILLEVMALQGWQFLLLWFVASALFITLLSVTSLRLSLTRGLPAFIVGAISMIYALPIIALVLH
ncbi:hypothetical protein MP228_007708 [Amoeboaphelidium protococcarum]|nr:hypothetical protein MP228_007708 [Amoeboaphelidium protococcarum]